MSILRIRDANGKIIEIPALKGNNGKSAYEIAVDKGYKGTEDEYYVTSPLQVRVQENYMCISEDALDEIELALKQKGYLMQ